MDVGIGPMARAGALDDGVDQALGAAYIQVLARRRGGQQRLEVEAAGRVVVGVQRQGAVRQGLQLGQEGKLVLAAAAVMQVEGAAGGLQRGGHGRDGRDADAARDQHDGLVTGGRFVQRKVVLGAFDRQGVAFGQRMHVAGSALAGFLEPHAQAVFGGLGEPPGLGRKLDQRIAARIAQAGYRDLQVRARSEGGQRTGVRARQAKRTDQRRFLPDFLDDQFECLHDVCLFQALARTASSSAIWRSMGPHFSWASAVSRSARSESAAPGRPASWAAAAISWRYLPPPRTCVSL
ncbi:hypothetical protein D3C85_683610 [compost metagenome]